MVFFSVIGAHTGISEVASDTSFISFSYKNPSMFLLIAPSPAQMGTKEERHWEGLSIGLWPRSLG